VCVCVCVCICLRIYAYMCVTVQMDVTENKHTQIISEGKLTESREMESREIKKTFHNVRNRCEVYKGR